MSERYDNFTAYYNTFYNAENAYREGIEALEKTEEKIDRRQYISIFEAPGQAANAQKFQAAIDKSADVLRDHPNSKWVDDALLLIGKSYFYQQNYVGAEQKFREVISMGSPLEDESRLWLARTLIAAGAFDEARDHLLLSLNREDLSKRWEPSLQLALGELHVYREDYDTAADQLATALENVRDNQREARGWFLLGQVYETLGRYEDAVEAYERVAGAHPRYELAYAAQYSATRVEGLYVDSENALRKLRRMERDDKNYSNRFELAYLRARIYQAEGYAGDARALYDEILYDSEGQISDLRGRVHYALGELYRDDYLDFEMASAYFDTARTALQPAAPSAGGQGSGDDIYAPEAITDAVEQAQMFGSFAEVRTRIAEMDSLLYLGSLSDEDFQAKIMEIRRQLAEEMAEEQRRVDRMQAQRGFQNAGAATADQRGSSGGNAAASGGTAGFLFHRDPVRVQEGRMSFIERWGERPLAPNWRRIEAIESVAGTEEASQIVQRAGLTDNLPTVDGQPLPPIDYSNVPRDSLSRAALRAERAVARYELANVLFLSMERPDSAATWYRAVIDEDTEFPVAQRAFYALAEVHQSLGDSVAARRLYEQVLQDYPKSDFAGRVRERLGIRSDVPSDTLALAEGEYGLAYQRWRRGSYREALNSMVEVAGTYPRLEVAPRALLAAGRIYMEWATRDSIDIFGPLPLSVPDSVLGRAGLLSVATAAQVPAPNAPDADAAAAQSEAGAAAPQNVPDAAADSFGAGNATQPVPEGAQTQPTRKGQAGVVPFEVDEELTRPPLKGAPDAPADSLARQRSAQAGPDVDPLEQAEASENAAAIATETPDAAAQTAAADSAAVENDVAEPVAQQAARADSTAQSLDESVLGGEATADDSLADAYALVDSLTTDDSLAATSGMIASAEKDDIYLKTLYAGVKQNYPQTAYAEQADRYLKVLDERQSDLQAVADSLARAISAAADSAAGRTGPRSLAADSLAAHGDSLATQSDSLASPSDSLAIQPDSLAAEPDSLAAEPDSLAAEPDSLAAEPDSVVAAIKSLGEAAEPASPPGDSVPNVTPADSRVAASPDSDGGSAIPTGDAAIRGEGGIDKTLGGFTFVVGMDTKEATMRALAKKYADMGFRSDVIVERGADETVYRAAIGHFRSEREAGMLLQTYITQISETVQITPLSDLE